MLQKHSLVILFLHRKMMFFFFLVPLNLVLGDQFISFRGDKPNRSLRQCSDPGVISCERVTANLQRQLSFVLESDDKIDNLWGGRTQHNSQRSRWAPRVRILCSMVDRQRYFLEKSEQQRLNYVYRTHLVLWLVGTTKKRQPLTHFISLRITRA